MNSVEIPEFDLSNIKDNSCILIIGPSSSGKTTLVDKILKNKSDITFGFAVSLSELHKPTLKNSIHYFDNNIYYKYEQSIIFDFLSKIESDCFNCFVLEDALNHQELTKDKLLHELFIYNTEYNLTNIVSGLYLPIMGPQIRKLFDYIFVSKCNYNGHLERIYKYYGEFTTLDEFTKKHQLATDENFSFMVIDNTAATEKIKKIKIPNIDEISSEEETEEELIITI